ncbi:hypothetical protein MMC29_002133 [Sticta canariensis]|nr:hypothetical protein [Sticta canariensis]
MSAYPIDDNVVFDDTEQNAEQLPDNKVDDPERDSEYELDDEYVRGDDNLEWNEDENLDDDDDVVWEDVNTTPPIDSSELLEADKELMLSWVAPTVIVRTPLPDDPEQAAKILARSRKALRRRGAFATAGASTSGVSVAKDLNRSPQHLDKDKGMEEDLIDAPIHKHSLTTEEEEGLNRLTPRQTQHLIEKFWAQIAAGSRPGHRAEYLAETLGKVQTNLESKLAAEAAKWEEERRSTGERLKVMEQELHASFSNGEAKGKMEAESQMGSLQQHLIAKNKEIIDLKNEQTTQRLDHLAAIRASYSSGESKGKSEVGSQMASLQQDLITKDQRITHLENQLTTQQRHHLAAIRDLDVSKLTEMMSTLKIQKDPAALELANSRVEKLQQKLADRKTIIRGLRNDLASHKSLLKSSKADLQNLQAARAEDRADDLSRRQGASILEGFRKVDSERISEQLEKSAAVAIKAAEDEVRAQGVISGLKRDLEASNAELARQEKASKEATLEKHNLQSQMGQLEEENRVLLHMQRVLEGRLEKENDLRQDISALFVQLRQAEEKTGVVRKELARVRGQWEHSRAAVRRLGNEVAEHRWLAEREAAKVRKLEKRWEKAQAAAPPSETAVAKEAENGEREMNALLGRSKKANEGFLRSLFLRRTDFFYFLW